MEFEKLYVQEKEKSRALEEKVLKTQYMFQANTIKNYDEINKDINKANEELSKKLKTIESVSVSLFKF